MGFMNDKLYERLDIQLLSDLQLSKLLKEVEKERQERLSRLKSVLKP